MDKKIPGPSIQRLSLIYRYLEEIEEAGEKNVFSSQLGKELGITAHSIRKDISFLGEVGNTIAGYDVSKLKELIYNKLGLGRPMKVCIVGLGRLGSALLKSDRISSGSYDLVAGFDKNINTLELLRTKVPLYPAYEITDVVKSKSIDLGFITVPRDAAQDAADRLIKGGIRGIVNFAPVMIKTNNPSVFIRNIDVLAELRLLTAFLGLDQEAEENTKE